MDNPKFFKAWILFFVVATIGGFIVGAIVGAIAGFVLAVVSGGTLNVADYQIYFQALGWLASLPVSYFVFKWSVSTFMLPQFRVGIPSASEFKQAEQDIANLPN